MELKSFLQETCHDGFLSLADHTEATVLFGMSYREIETASLALGIVPLRYQRNQSSISPQQQQILFDTHVAIIGCGGLGGHIAEILTRIGLGTLTLFDFDHFEEHNLNRQNFSTLESLDRKKVFVVKEGLERINPSIVINAHDHRFDPRTDMPTIQSSAVVIDALDTPSVKLALSHACKTEKKHFIHGAIAGFYGQFSSDNTLESLYPNGGRGAEIESGNPAFTVTHAASIQAAEAIKAILGMGERLTGSFMVTDLLDHEYTRLPL